MMAVIIAGSLLVGMMVSGKETRPVSRLIALAILLASLGTLPLMAFGGDDQIRKRTFKTIANGRTGISEAVDIGKSRGAPGDMFVFDQPLLDAGGKVIGANAGFCVRTTPGEFSVCQWTLAMANGSLTVAGREAEGKAYHILTRDGDLVIAIDDVGTGHSGLSYMLKLGVDIIKIDKVFIDSIGTDRNSNTIIETLIDLAQNMRMDIVAEGVESFEQVVALKELGIRLAQGYVFSPPLPGSSFLQLVEAIDPLKAKSPRTSLIPDEPEGGGVDRLFNVG